MKVSLSLFNIVLIVVSRGRQHVWVNFPQSRDELDQSHHDAVEWKPEHSKLSAPTKRKDTATRQPENTQKKKELKLYVLEKQLTLNYFITSV